MSLRSKPLILFVLRQQRIALLFAARRVLGLAAICVRRKLFRFAPNRSTNVSNKIFLRLLQRAQRVAGFAAMLKKSVLRAALSEGVRAFRDCIKRERFDLGMLDSMTGMIANESASLGFMQGQQETFSAKQNGASLKLGVSTPSFALNIGVAVIDGDERALEFSPIYLCTNYTGLFCPMPQSWRRPGDSIYYLSLIISFRLSLFGDDLPDTVFNSTF
jgi:hypothetical protein